MYETNSIKWINLKSKSQEYTKPSRLKFHTAESTKVLGEVNYAPSDCLARKGQSCQLESST